MTVICACGHALAWHYHATALDPTQACFGRVCEGQDPVTRCQCPDFTDPKEAILDEGLYAARQYFSSHAKSKPKSEE